MIGRLLLLLGCLASAVALASCSSVPDLQVPEQVLIQVPVPCISPADRPARPPVRSEADLMAMDRYRRTLAAWSDLKRLERYSAELEAIVEGCARVKGSP